jgi:hypothetical protein
VLHDDEQQPDVVALVGDGDDVGVEDVVTGELRASADYTGFDDFWEPFTWAVGPAGQYLMSLPEEQREQVREGCREALPSGPFTLTARAWYARGTVAAAS